MDQLFKTLNNDIKSMPVRLGLKKHRLCFLKKINLFNLKQGGKILYRTHVILVQVLLVLEQEYYPEVVFYFLYFALPSFVYPIES